MRKKSESIPQGLKPASSRSVNAKAKALAYLEAKAQTGTTMSELKAGVMTAKIFIRRNSSQLSTDFTN